jgi:membrane protease YdiL (CAAX protease family)
MGSEENQTVSWRIDAWGTGFLVFIGIGLPFLAYRTRRMLGGGLLPIPRAVFYWQTILFQIVIYGFALFAAGTNSVALQLLPTRPRAMWAIALLVVALSALRIFWPTRSLESKRRLCDLLPHNRAELVPYLLLCVVAAIAEEVAYRGVAYWLVFRVTHSIPLAVGIVAIAFALGHMLQGWRSVGVILLFAVGFHAVVIYGQSLLPAILVHFAYDAIAWLVVPRWCAKESVLVSPPP